MSKIAYQIGTYALILLIPLTFFIENEKEGETKWKTTKTILYKYEVSAIDQFNIQA